VKIVVVCPHFEDPGGVREVVTRVAEAHTLAGHHVDVLTRARQERGRPDPPRFEGMGVWRVPMAPAPHRDAGWRPMRRFLRRSSQGIWPFTKRLRALSPDIVATHCSKFYAPWVQLAQRAVRAPVVAHLHNAERTADGPDSPFWSRLLFASVDHVIAVSPEVGSYAVRRCPRLAGSVDIIRNGIAPGDFANVIAEERAHPYLLAVGRLAPQKGFDILVDAIARTTTRPSLLLAGSGPAAKQLQAQVAERGLTARVEFLGEVPRERVKCLLRGATAVSMPSRFEGNPLIALEAMQAGAPLIASAIPGLPEELVHGVTGILVPPEDPIALARAIDQIVSNSAEAERLGHAAAEASRAFPSWDAVADAVLAVYQQVAHST
jgi:glycosyltransferase involved in cell wall biosynthesis